MLNINELDNIIMYDIQKCICKTLDMRDNIFIHIVMLNITLLLYDFSVFIRNKVLTYVFYEILVYTWVIYW